MAKTVKKVSVVSSLAVEKTIETSVGNLAKACSDAAAAVATKTKETSKLAAEIKRCSKKRVTLMKRKKIAANKLKKESSADNRKALKEVEKEITSVAKELGKFKPIKASVSEELTALKGHYKRVAAYVGAFEKADKILNKPKKKLKKRKKAKNNAVISLVSSDSLVANAA